MDREHVCPCRARNPILSQRLLRSAEPRQFTFGARYCDFTLESDALKNIMV